MELVEMLTARKDAVLSEAAGLLGRAHLTHYDSAGPATSRQRLEQLFGLVLECLRDRTLGPVCEFGERVAKERFEAGFDIGEVQTAFNVLEEAIWQLVLVDVAPAELSEAAGLVGTVLGAGKDALARTWVSLAAERHVPSLDLAALFEGSRG